MAAKLKDIAWITKVNTEFSERAVMLYRSSIGEALDEVMRTEGKFCAVVSIFVKKMD